MVQVTLDVTQCRLQVEGHAATAPYGQDTVCAALSILTLLAAHTVARLTDIGWVHPSATLQVASGRAVVSCRPKWGRRRQVRALFSHWGQGFALLAGLAPQTIHYVKKGAIGHGANRFRFAFDRATHSRDG